MQFEFAYDILDKDGMVTHQTGIVKCRELGGEGKWTLWDLNPGRKPWCWDCSSFKQNIIRHPKGTRCPRINAAQARRREINAAEVERVQAKSAGRQSAVPETPDSDASESSLADDADASVESDPEFFVNGWPRLVKEKLPLHCMCTRLFRKMKLMSKRMLCMLQKVARQRVASGEPTGFRELVLVLIWHVCSGTYVSTSRQAELVEKATVSIFFRTLKSGKLSKKLKDRIARLEGFQKLSD